ncbi:MAG: hypothetical protein Ct9H300mP21_09750 [Pseudomonadota bacterium]|nr:MAG: hypothetical protein Ct9H300mP21_09750 [Pseudomonadota bacterium]
MEFHFGRPLSQNILDDNKKAVDEAAAIQAECLVMVVGGLKPNSKDLAGSHRQVEEGLFKTLEYARTVKMPVAIEPLHPMYAADRACVNTLKHALDLCDQMGEELELQLTCITAGGTRNWNRRLNEQVKTSACFPHLRLAFGKKRSSAGSWNDGGRSN